MAISDKLTYLNTTKGKIKDAINLTNANILSEDTFRSYAEKLKLGLVDIINNGTDDLYDSFPKTTGTGTEIALNDTYEAPMRVDLNGNTHQDSYTGKNLSYFNRISRNGITFEGNDIDVLNPTAYLYASQEWNMKNDSSLSGKTYTIYSLANGTTGDKPITLQIGKTGNNYAFQHVLSANTTYTNNLKVQTVTLGADEVFTLINLYVSGSTTANVNYKFMVVKGSYTAQTIGDYEPFVGGSPSPSPDYPQQIEVVTGDNTINIHGKNLLNDYDLINRYNIDSVSDNILTTKEINSNYSVFQPRTKTQKIDLVENTKYYVSFDCRLKSGTYSAKLGASIIDGINGTSYSTGNTAISNPNMSSLYQRYSFECISNITTNSVLGITIQVQTRLSNAVFEIKNIMISTSNNNSYKPYQSATYPISLGDIELCKIGDYQDYIYKENNKWYKHSEIGKVDFGNISWDSARHAAPNYRRYNTNKISNVKYVSLNTQLGVGLCEKYKIHTGNGMSGYGSENCFAIDISMIQAVDKTTPSGLFYYALNTPTNTEITDTDLIEQLEELEKAKSVENKTIISQTNANLPFIISASALSKN